MEKITITPEYCEQFRVFAMPAAMSISKQATVFNMAAVKVLALKKGSHFTLSADDRKLYLQLEARGFEIRSELKHAVSGKSVGLFEFMHKHTNQTIGQVKTFKFEIGEFKNGAYPLELKEIVKRPTKAAAK